MLVNNFSALFFSQTESSRAAFTGKLNKRICLAVGNSKAFNNFDINGMLFKKLINRRNHAFLVYYAPYSPQIRATSSRLKPYSE